MPSNDQQDNIIGDVQSAIAAGAALSEPRAVPESPTPTGLYTVVPEGYTLESLEDFLPRPLRVRQAVLLHDAESFIAYVKEFGDHETSRIFFDQDRETFAVIIDYHGGNGQPAWCGHTGSFTARRSVEFTTWLNQNRKQMNQVDFARFIEENLPDVVEPAGATLLEIALTFEAKKDVEFASGVRLNNGQVQFTYNEVVRGTAQKGTIEIPEKFVLGIPIHIGGPAYRIDVRLRWRLHEGRAMFAYELVRPHRYVEDALKEIRERIGRETGLEALAGVAK
jgi:uncharacterized protein YfdQ (DUF2303 family)